MAKKADKLPPFFILLREYWDNRKFFFYIASLSNQNFHVSLKSQRALIINGIDHNAT